MLLDGYLQNKNKQLARATPFEVHIHPHTAVGDLSSLRDQMSYPSITVHEASESLPLKWSQSHPCMGKKILCFFFEPIGTSELSFVLTGTRFLFLPLSFSCEEHACQVILGTSGMTSRRLGSREAGPRTTDTTVSSRTWTSPIVMGSKKSCLWLIYCTSRHAVWSWTQHLSLARQLQSF